MNFEKLISIKLPNLDNEVVLLKKNALVSSHKGYLVASLEEPEWLSCRETFHSRMNNKKSSIFYYSIKNYSEDNDNYIDIYNYLKFMINLENYIMKTSKIKFPYSKVNLTNSQNILKIFPSIFWFNESESLLKFSLFTIFLRAGLDYKDKTKGSLFNCINKYDYVLKTKKVIDKFFRGYTYFIKLSEGIENSRLNDTHGFVNVFTNSLFSQQAIVLDKVLHRNKFAKY